MDLQKIEEAVKMFLEAIGKILNREGLQGTPLRVARMCEEAFSGMDKVADEDYLLVLVKNMKKWFSEDIPLFIL